jgi:hypothetical protein
VANNTYLQRRGSDAIAVRLHATDVVTFRADGTIVLSTGGWFTVTTKARMNEWLPAPFCIFSKRGTWFVTLSWRTVDHAEQGYTWQSREPAEMVPYFDGMILDATRSALVNRSKAPDSAARDKRNDRTRKQVARYVALYSDARIAELLKQGASGDCFFCMMRTDNGTPLGDHTGDTEHLRSHMAEKYTMLSTLYNAVKAKGYRDPVFILRYAPDLARRALSVYLRKRLMEATIVN